MVRWNEPVSIGEAGDDADAGHAGRGRDRRGDQPAAVMRCSDGPARQRGRP